MLIWILQFHIYLELFSASWLVYWGPYGYDVVRNESSCPRIKWLMWRRVSPAPTVLKQLLLTPEATFAVEQSHFICTTKHEKCANSEFASLVTAGELLCNMGIRNAWSLCQKCLTVHKFEIFWAFEHMSLPNRSSEITYLFAPFHSFCVSALNLFRFPHWILNNAGVVSSA